MVARLLPTALSLAGALALGGCVVEEECTVIGSRLSLTDFDDDFLVPSGLTMCAPNQGPCVGEGGRIAFLPEQLEVASPTDRDLWGAAVGVGDDVRFYAVGAAGTLAMSVDDRDAWRSIEIETTADLWSVAAIDGTGVVVAVGDGVIVRSDDAGESWVVEPAGKPAPDRLLALSDGTVLATGPDGFMATSDDGRTWTSVPSPTDRPITALHRPFDEVLVADAAGDVFSGHPGSDWVDAEVPGRTPVVSFAGQALVWALRADGTLAFRFEDEPWERSDHVAARAGVLSAAEWVVYPFGPAPRGLNDVGWTWVSSMCAVGADGSVESNLAWLDPVTECRF